MGHSFTAPGRNWTGRACWRLMEKLKKAFSRLPICLCADSLYACEGFFERCKWTNWRYILRYKEGSIPPIGAEYRELKKLEKNYQEHLYSKNYQAVKNHYYLIQIGHMIGQFMEEWEGIWKKVKQSLEQKHRRLLESMKEISLKEYMEEIDRKIQIRFI